MPEPGIAGPGKDKLASPLVLAAHGSVDPRFAAVVEELAALLRAARPALEVRIGYLDHGVPIESVTDESCVVVPLLLSRGFHIRQDIPPRAAGTVTPAIGPDARLVAVLAERLREAGWTQEEPVVLAATGSSDPQALGDVHQIAAALAACLDIAVSAAFIADGEPRLTDVPAAAVASYLLAPGRFHDVARAAGVEIVAAPLGAHRLIAEIITDRYDAALASR